MVYKPHTSWPSSTSSVIPLTPQNNASLVMCIYAYRYINKSYMYFRYEIVILQSSGILKVTFSIDFSL